MNVNINLPQSEFAILKKMAKALGWDLFVQQEDNHINKSKRNMKGPSISSSTLSA